MKIKLYTAAAFLGIALASCKDNKPTEAEYKYEPVITNTSSSTDSSNAKTQPQPQQSTNLIPNQQATNNTGVKLNPPHGQPGHSCEVADGAPLPNTTAPVTNQQQTVVTPTKVTIPTPTPSTKGLNPEHGKPGHRCDISVGAPLDSKPTVQTQTQQQPTVVTTPVKTVTPPGMNPPHGEPGHKCEVAVGAPLPKDDKKDSSKG